MSTCGTGYETVGRLVNAPEGKIADRSDLYRALAYGFGDEFAEGVCRAVDAEIERTSESATICAYRKAWLRRIGECAVHSGRLT